MMENTEKDIINLLDEEGNEHEFEIIDAVECDDQQYLALVPIFDEADESLEDSGELVILRVSGDEDDSGEQFLEAIEDEDEYTKVADMFMDRLKDEFDFADEDEPDEDEPDEDESDEDEPDEDESDEDEPDEDESDEDEPDED